jgi:hypothetical protein
MEMQLPNDFIEFLNLLTKNQVEYLLIGGYAVGFYGHVRATNDMDVWIKASTENALKAESAIREFGFDLPSLSADKLVEPGKITRMGHPPMRIEVLSSISRVSFDEV